MTRMPLSAACFLFLAGVGTVIAAEPAAAPPAVSGAPGPDTPTVPSSALAVTGTNTPGDAARINGVIAASPEGAEIVIRGACLIDEPIRLLGNRSYRGESRTGTVLKQADGANLVALMASSVFLDNKAWTGTPVAIRHLRLDGNRKGNPGSTTAGLVLRSWLSVVEDVHIRDMGSDGLRLTNLSADGTGLETTQVNGRIANCFIERSGRHGIFVQDTQNAVTDWILIDSWIASSGVDGIHLDNAAGWFVQRNHIYGVPRHAIFAHRVFARPFVTITSRGSARATNPACGTGSTPRCRAGRDRPSRTTGSSTFGVRNRTSPSIATWHSRSITAPPWPSWRTT